jgi:SpoVK/Ycf46/Vps4 family AAA+-type ATPase
VHYHLPPRTEYAKKFAFTIATLLLTTLVSYFASKYIGLDSLLGVEAPEKLTAHVETLLHERGVAQGALNEAERRMAATIVDTSELRSGIDAVGGLAGQKDIVWRSLVLPLNYWKAFYGDVANGIAKPPRGALFVGPPGTGKTLLARAVATEANATFMDVGMSTLENKYFGEANKNVAALFSLAEKLAPTVVLVDEIDGLLRERREDDASFVYNLKTEFLARLDGLKQTRKALIVIGATNSAASLDAALIRRLPLIVRFALPDAQDRLEVLACCCKAQGTAIPLPLLEHIAVLSEGASCSDLSEIVRLVLDRRQSALSNKPEYVRALARAHDEDIPLSMLLELPPFSEELVDAALDAWANATIAAESDTITRRGEARARELMRKILAG